MSNLFNLNIEEYNQSELEDLFSLEYPYNEERIKECGVKMQEKLFLDGGLDAEDKEKVIVFINLAMNELSNTITDSVLDPKLKSSNIVDSTNHMIIKKTQIPNAGVLNPYKISSGGSENIMLKTINIDTTFRNNYYNTKATDFHLTLPTTIKNVVEMRLVACELPQSIYAISSALGNSHFTLQWELSGGIAFGGSNHEINVVIPDGNYFPLPCENCQADMQTEINNQLSRPEPFGTGGKIQMIIDKRTGKTIFAGGGGPPYQVVDASGNPCCAGGKPCCDPSGNVVGTMNVTSMNLLFNTTNNANPEPDSTPVQLKLGWLLGYRFGKYSGNTAYTSEGNYDFRGPRYLYLSIDDYNKNHSENIIGVFNSSLTQPENILARLSWKQYAFFATNNEPMDIVSNSRNYFGPVDIQKLHIQLLDLYGRTVFLDNMDYSFALEFKCLYKV